MVIFFKVILKIWVIFIVLIIIKVFIQIAKKKSTKEYQLILFFKLMIFLLQRVEVVYTFALTI